MKQDFLSPAVMRSGALGPTIQTVDGNHFAFLSPQACDFDIHTIAHSLSHLCRFTGQCRSFYSVAQHSVLVSRLVPPELALQGLLHDAAEAFMGDVSRPLKQLLPDYRRLEKHVEEGVYARFGLPAVLHPDVKVADIVAFATERRDLMKDRASIGPADAIEPAPGRIRPWWPWYARWRFLSRYRELTTPVHAPEDFLGATIF